MTGKPSKISRLPELLVPILRMSEDAKVSLEKVIAVATSNFA